MALKIEVAASGQAAAPPDIVVADGPLTEAVRATLEHLRVAEGEISLTLLGDDEIADLNARYLGYEGPTDVLSFALYEADETPVGDIYIGYSQALRQAEALGIPAEQELVRLAAHGTLHVLGYDHPEGEAREASEMWAVQERIVAGLVRNLRRHA